MIKLFNLGSNHRAIKATCGNGFIELYYSYERLVAIRFPDRTSYRINPIPSATTTRHLKKMGVYDWPPASQSWFYNQVDAIELTFKEVTK